jgi:uncharacterized protein
MRRAAIAFAVFLVAWGNLTQRFVGETALLPGGSWWFIAIGMALVAVSFGFARWIGLDARSLGLASVGASRGAAIGILLGGVIAVIDVLALRLAPLVLGAPIVYEPVMQVTREQLAVHLAVFLPLGAVIPEEVAFRGVLLGALAREWGIRAAVLASAFAFALWHVAVVLATAANTTLGALAPLAVPGAIIILVVGGIVMASLRLRTRTLATSIAAHWIFNAVILVGFWSARRGE